MGRPQRLFPFINPRHAQTHGTQAVHQEHSLKGINSKILQKKIVPYDRH